MHRFGVPGFVLEQNQVITLVLQHPLGFFQRVGMVEFSREQAARALQNLANQVEVFLFVAHQQDLQRNWRQGGFCGRQH